MIKRTLIWWGFQVCFCIFMNSFEYSTVGKTQIKLHLIWWIFKLCFAYLWILMNIQQLENPDQASTYLMNIQAMSCIFMNSYEYSTGGQPRSSCHSREMCRELRVWLISLRTSSPRYFCFSTDCALLRLWTRWESTIWMKQKQWAIISKNFSREMLGRTCSWITQIFA